MSKMPMGREPGLMYRAGKLLHQYKDDHSLTWSGLADKFGASQTLMSKWMRGETEPSVTAALQIERITKGAVPVKSWTQLDRSKEGAKIQERRERWRKARAVS